MKALQQLFPHAIREVRQKTRRRRPFTIPALPLLSSLRRPSPNLHYYQLATISKPLFPSEHNHNKTISTSTAPCDALAVFPCSLCLSSLSFTSFCFSLPPEELQLLLSTRNGKTTTSTPTQVSHIECRLSEGAWSDSRLESSRVVLGVELGRSWEFEVQLGSG
jgi:hypothetical protein